MRHALRLGLFAGLSIALFACGSGAKLGGGKEGAAAALFAATSQTKASGALLSVLGQGAVDLSGGVTAACEHGGKVTLKAAGASINLGTGSSLKTSYTVLYDNCAATTYDNPNTPAVEKDNVVLNGTITVSQDVNVSSTSGSVSQSIQGKLTYGGAFDDFLDIDITQAVDWSKLGTRGGSVSIALEGKLATSTDSYTYAKEAVTITAGVLVAAEKKP